MSLVCSACRINFSKKRKSFDGKRNPEKKTIIRGEMGVMWRDTIRRVIWSEIDIFEGSKSKGLSLQYFSLFIPFQLLSLNIQTHEGQ